MGRFRVANRGILINSKDSKVKQCIRIPKAKFRDRAFIEEVKDLALTHLVQVTSPDLRAFKAPEVETKSKTLMTNTMTFLRD